MANIKAVIDEQVVPGKRLGRNLNFDERSKGFRAPVEGVELVSKTWERRVRSYDQGDLGSCTGNATAGMLMTSPYRVWGAPTLKEANAVQIYSIATQIDNYDGSYPPEDTGSSGLAALKAAAQLGYIHGYQWGFGIDDALRILSGIGPVITGFNWYSSFDEPDPRGLVTITGNAYVRGGHEVELLGIDVKNRVVQAVNSWGPRWGKHGRFFMSWADYARLLSEDGEVATAAPAPATGPGA